MARQPRPVGGLLAFFDPLLRRAALVVEPHDRATREDHVGHDEARVDQKSTITYLSYRWWPESWIVNWGPRVNYRRNYNFNSVLEDEQMALSVDAQFARNIDFNASVSRDIERFLEIDFWKTRYLIGALVR